MPATDDGGNSFKSINVPAEANVTMVHSYALDSDGEPFMRGYAIIAEVGDVGLQLPYALPAPKTGS